jgi:hypothetical protein
MSREPVGIFDHYEDDHTYEAFLRERLAERGYRMMRRRKGQCEYWVMFKEPMTLDATGRFLSTGNIVLNGVEVHHKRRSRGARR